jgi:hypothetical protein
MRAGVAAWLSVCLTGDIPQKLDLLIEREMH